LQLVDADRARRDGFDDLAGDHPVQLHGGDGAVAASYGQGRRTGRDEHPDDVRRPFRRADAEADDVAGAHARDTRNGQVPEEDRTVTYVIAEPCVDVLDKACIEECPVDCIYEGNRMLYIHPDECVDCGACEPVCPVEAIFYEDDTPDQWKDYYKANVEFFDDLGSPGGASKVGKIEKDHPLVAALPADINADKTGH
jgi:NAD-dependent dihydropyrimidine dehydrogenase PreA subunit